MAAAHRLHNAAADVSHRVSIVADLIDCAFVNYICLSDCSNIQHYTAQTIVRLVLPAEAQQKCVPTECVAHGEEEDHREGDGHRNI